VDRFVLIRDCVRNLKLAHPLLSEDFGLIDSHPSRQMTLLFLTVRHQPGSDSSGESCKQLGQRLLLPAKSERNNIEYQKFLKQSIIS
jgi:hypothetical protein